MRTSFLPFHLPDIGPREEAAVLRTLRSGWLTTGQETHLFEAEFAAAIGSRHAVAVNSCTAALHLALEAAGVGAGDEVIVPTMTFAASAEVVAYLNARPVLVDSEPDTLNLSPAAVERALSARTRAVMPVHFGGHPCELDELMSTARRHSIAVIEDAAHSFPASYRGRAIGTIGDATCFSFYATKTITTGEGGMVTTDDDRVVERVRMMSLHGISKDAWKRYTAEGSWRYEILRPGFKYNLTDIAAAIGRVQLARRDEFRVARRHIAGRYDEAFGHCPELSVPTARGHVEHAWHLYVIRIDEQRLAIDRGTFIERLKDQGIGASVHFIPLHLHPYYRDTFGYQADDFPIATAAFHRTVSLPIYPRMSDGDVDDVIAAVKRVIVQHRRQAAVAVASVAPA